MASYDRNGRIMFDVGDVLSIRNAGREIHWYVTPGAYACILLTIWRYGPDRVCIVSRANTASCESNYEGREHDHWVIKFLKALGLFNLGVPEANVWFCKKKSDKGPVSEHLNIKCFVDNDVQCAESMIGYGRLKDAESNNTSFWVHYDSRYDGWKPDMPRMSRRLTTFWRPASCFRGIAEMLGLLDGIPDYVWSKLCALGHHHPPLQIAIAQAPLPRWGHPRVRQTSPHHLPMACQPYCRSHAPIP